MSWVLVVTRRPKITYTAISLSWWFGPAEIGDGLVVVEVPRRGQHLLVSVAQRSLQVGHDLTVQLRIRWPRARAHLPVAALGEREEPPRTLNPTVAELCRRPQLQGIASHDHIPEALGCQQRLPCVTLGTRCIPQLECRVRQPGQRR